MRLYIGLNTVRHRLSLIYSDSLVKLELSGLCYVSFFIGDFELFDSFLQDHVMPIGAIQHNFPMSCKVSCWTFSTIAVNRCLLIGGLITTSCNPNLLLFVFVTCEPQWITQLNFSLVQISSHHKKW